MTAAPSYFAASSTQSVSAPPRRRWFQFSLRTLTIFMVVCSLFLGAFGWRLQRARQQAETVAAIREMRGTVLYDYEVEAIKQGVAKWPPPSRWPSFLVKALGQDFFYNVYAVNTGDQTPSNEERVRFWDFVVRFSKLHQLVLSSEWMDREGLSRLRNPQELETLAIASCRVTDDDLKIIGSMTRLKTLQIYGAENRIGDEGIAALDDLSELQAFILGNSEITDDAAPHLAKHRKLANLQLVRNHLTDKSTPWLGQLTELSQLSIINTEIGDIGLGNLKHLTKLEYLYADDTKITDDGLAHLAHMTGLQTLTVRRTKVTSEGVAQFKARVPTCMVNH